MIPSWRSWPTPNETLVDLGRLSLTENLPVNRSGRPDRSFAIARTPGGRGLPVLYVFLLRHGSHDAG